MLNDMSMFIAAIKGNTINGCKKIDAIGRTTKLYYGIFFAEVSFDQ